jgi:hypothetical protein
LGVIQFEPERLDQVQRRSRGGAESGDIAGIWRYFGFEQDDVHVASRG